MLTYVLVFGLFVAAASAQLNCTYIQDTTWYELKPGNNTFTREFVSNGFRTVVESFGECTGPPENRECFVSINSCMIGQLGTYNCSCLTRPKSEQICQRFASYSQAPGHNPSRIDLNDVLAIFDEYAKSTCDGEPCMLEADFKEAVQRTVCDTLWDGSGNPVEREQCSSTDALLNCLESIAPFNLSNLLGLL
ncbi:unnamed protein product [Owenia fusiformis]|uniref:Uncharacterized protein n=1 Tax=Owenia fusiformis TaxID=6347 RepID=A0A8J1Y1I3_OWEFU|nr:unnamed protein product [Owenia fusiformis]